MKKILSSLIILSLGIVNVQAQEEIKPINTGAVNFLTISSDARGAAMGGAGVALSGNDNAIFYNASAVVLDESSRGGVGYSYIPWMREYNSDFNLNSFHGFYKIDSRNAFLASFQYFKQPEIGAIENGTDLVRLFSPNEMAIDFGYARQLTNNLAVSLTAKYIRSDMGDIDGAKVANAVGFDFGAMYKGNLNLIQDATWGVGLQMSNFGTKIKYLDTKESLPVTAKLGGSLDLPFTSAHRLAVVADVGYRLVQSDMQAFNISAGAEYTLIEHIMLRGGYHYGDKKKGDASYATAGLGAKYYGVHMDFAWLFAESNSPIRNTFWLTAGYSF